MMRSRRTLVVTVFVLLMGSFTSAQWPLGPNFMSGFSASMNNMMQNLQTNLQVMGQRINANTQRMAEQAAWQNELARTRMEGMQPGTWRQFEDANGRGYIYRNPNGGYSSFTYSGSGAGTGTGSGYLFQTGPHGTFERRW